MCVAEAEEGLAFELHSEERLDYPILQPPLEVEIRAAELRQPPIDERRLGLRLGAVAPEEARFVGVDARREAHVRAVIPRPARHASEITEMAPRMIQVPVVAETVAGPEEVGATVRIEEDFPRMRSEDLKAEGRLLVEPEAPVEAAQLVMLLDEVITGGDQPQVPFLADVTLEAQDADVCVLVQKTLDVRARLRIVALVLAEIAG